MLENIEASYILLSKVYVPKVYMNNYEQCNLIEIKVINKTKKQLFKIIAISVRASDLCITKPCTHLHPAPSTSTQLHPPLPSSLQHPQQYFNQNMARNWTVSPNLGRKIKNCPFWLKFDTHGILEVLIPIPEVDIWNSNPKIHFCANLGPKIQSCPFCLKIGAHSISRMLIPYPDLDFWNFDPKIHFWANLGPKTQSCPFCLKIGTHGISRMLILIPALVFWISNPNFLFRQISAKKVSNLF